MSEIVDKLKLSMRIRHSLLDSEIEELVAAAKLDMSVKGVAKICESDPLIFQAIKLYVKSNFDDDKVKSDRYINSYILLCDSLALCGDYNTIQERVYEK